MTMAQQGLFGHRDLSYIMSKFKYLPLSYVGSKKRFLHWLWFSIEDNNFSDFETIVDPYGGSAIVSFFMRLLDKNVYCNDVLSVSHNILTALVENPGVIVEEQELLWLTNHSIVDTKLVDTDFSYEDIGHFNERNFSNVYFTPKEAIFLDCFFHKLGLLDSKFNLSPDEYRYKKSICLASIFAFANLLPFGSVSGSKLMNYRKEQKDKYNERCKGFYLDDEYNLHLYWIANYIRKFSEYVVLAKDCNAGSAFNLDVSDFLALDEVQDMDLLYLDPPYGGTFSDYLSLYNFAETLVTQTAEPNHSNHKLDFSNAAIYDDNFHVILEQSKPIPRWVISYNSNAWQDIDYIADIVGDYKSNVVICSHKNELQERGAMVSGKKTEEYLIFAH